MLDKKRTKLWYQGRKVFLHVFPIEFGRMKEASEDDRTGVGRVDRKTKFESIHRRLGTIDTTPIVSTIRWARECHCGRPALQ